MKLTFGDVFRIGITCLLVAFLIVDINNNKITTWDLINVFLVGCLAGLSLANIAVNSRITAMITQDIKPIMEDFFLLLSKYAQEKKVSLSEIAKEDWIKDLKVINLKDLKKED